MTALPMFPLGSVLLPAMPLRLRVFEPRYLALLAEVLPADDPEFGIVLIERGSEVGGGDSRFEMGTVARILEVQATDEAIVIQALGGRRVRITGWIDDRAFPCAEVEDVPELHWDDALEDLRERTETRVREALAEADELGAARWSPFLRLDEDPVAAVWQLAAIAPIGPLDRYRLLRSATVEELLQGTADAVDDALTALRFGFDADE